MKYLFWFLCFVLRRKDTGTELFSEHEFFLLQVEGIPRSRKRVKNHLFWACSISQTDVYDVDFVLESRAESRFCQNAGGHWCWSLSRQLSVITVGRRHRNRKLIPHVFGAEMVFRCFRNEARKLLVTIWQSYKEPRGIFCGCIVIVKYLRAVYKKGWNNSTEK